MDGVLTDKEREVIFRKSKEFGVPEDECEIILEGMIYKKGIKEEVKSGKNKIENDFSNDEVFKVKKLEYKETQESVLKKIFESTPLDTINKHEENIIKLNNEVNKVQDEIISLENEDKNLSSEIVLLNKKISDLVESKKPNFDSFKKEVSPILDDSTNDLNIKFEKHQVCLYEITLFKLTTGFFGKPKKGSELTIPIIEILDNLIIGKIKEYQTIYYLEKKDIDLLNELVEIYQKFQKEKEVESSQINLKIDDHRNLISKKNDQKSKNGETLITSKKNKNELNEQIKGLDNEIKSFKEIISSKNFQFFKELYDKSPILYQSNIFSKYLEIIEVKNDKEIMNLTRFINFIKEKEKDYSEEIRHSFNKLKSNQLVNSEIDTLLKLKKDLLLFYNSFHLMYQSLVTGKMGLYMNVYIQLESIGIFNTFFEKNVVKNLNVMNKHLESISSTLVSINSQISQTNDYLNLLNENMYQLKLNVEETNEILEKSNEINQETNQKLNQTNLNLQDVSYSIQEGNQILSENREYLEKINSGVKLKNILSTIQTYQTYQINKSTKSLKG